MYSHQLRCVLERVCGTRGRSSAAHGPTATRTCRLHPAPIPLYNWSGFYVGGNLGAGWNSGGSVSDTFGSTFSGSGQTTKFLGGGQVGVNYEFYGGVVVGAEAMFDWLPNTTNTFTATQGKTLGGAPGSWYVASATFNSRWLTPRLRKLGYAWDRVLLYGKAGGAWVGATILTLRSMGAINALQ